MVDTDPAWINASGGAPLYSAAELRRLDSVLLWAGTTDRLGARQGVRPGHVPASLAGTTWTVHDTAAVVYPGETSTSGPYRVAILETTGTVTAAEGQPRKDILYVQVQDNDEDGSGQRRARPGYLAGSASGSPVEPTVPDGAFKIATIDVPASGGGSPTITVNAPAAVAAGGILPVPTHADLPTTGVTPGMFGWRLDSESLSAYTSGGWRPVASTKIPIQRIYTANDTWTRPTGLKYVTVEVQGGGGAGGGAVATAADQSSAGAGGQGGAYARTTFSVTQVGATEQVTVGVAGAAVSGGTGGSGGTSSFGVSTTLVSAAGGVGGIALSASSTFGFNHGADSTQSMTGVFQQGGGGSGPVGRGGTQSCHGSAGGNAVLGHGGGGRGGPAAAGFAGKTYGGGGGGAANVLSSTAKAGGAGGAGVVIVTEYY